MNPSLVPSRSRVPGPSGGRSDHRLSSKIHNTVLSTASGPYILGGLLVCLALLILPGCATLYKAENEPLTTIDEARGYRLLKARHGDFGDHLVFLAFSGGGTRAAALSYGVLQELRDTRLARNSRKPRLLDEVDSISSVSGGSFTAAYYGLFGDRIFRDYEQVFLRHSVQSALIGNLFNPAYWWRSLFSGLDRTEMAIEYYDSEIFEHKTFADFELGAGPFVEINATDLGGGTRFAFVQAYFDMICSDLAKMSVARAVTASSAVPLAFPTVVLKNYAGDCNYRNSRLARFLLAQDDHDPRIRDLKERFKAYTNRKANPYIHLVDGGVVDNLGLRAVTDRIETFGAGSLLDKSRRLPRSIMVVSVNAAVDPEGSINQSADKPSMLDTIDAFSDVQMSLYNEETKLLLTNKLDEFRRLLEKDGHQVDLYQVEVSFQSLRSDAERTYFNRLPTSLELSDADVDRLIAAGRDLLRHDPEFRRFVVDTGSARAPIAFRSTH